MDYKQKKGEENIPFSPFPIWPLALNLLLLDMGGKEGTKDNISSSPRQ
jgi:hypothetical protein